MKARWLSRTVLAGPHLILCTDEKDYRAIIKRLKIENPLGFLGSVEGASTHTFERKETGYLACVVTINIIKGRGIDKVAALLAHEATHIKQEFFQFIGERNPGIEIEAYVMENITRELIDEYKRQAKLK